jgi:hypothetical protein
MEAIYDWSTVPGKKRLASASLRIQVTASMVLGFSGSGDGNLKPMRPAAGQ